MKIAFIVGSIEAARDGVGDYTRLLARECVHRGHKCIIIALNDCFAKDIVNSDETVDLNILRLPTNISWKDRCRIAKDRIDGFGPDWVSLQFVCHGYNKKGVIALESSHIVNLLAGRHSHVMFHELWAGATKKIDLKAKLLGSVQQLFVLIMTKALNPDIIHTNIQMHADILNRHGINAGILPLFGNIPITNQKGDAWLFQKLNEVGLRIDSDIRSDFWLFGIFGALHADWHPEPLMSYLIKAAARYRKKICVISAGDVRAGDPVWKKLSSTYAKDLAFLKLGHLSDQNISEFFNSLDFGIATTAYGLYGKSGAAIAMIEHGLPVLINKPNAYGKEAGSFNATDGPSLNSVDESLIDKLPFLNRQPPKSGLQEVAAAFLVSLKKAAVTMQATK